MKANTDPAVLAREVVEKCDIIHKSQLSDVEQIIYYLKNRKDLQGNGENNYQTKAPSTCDATKVSIRNIEDYIELLYEDLQDKIQGSSCLLQLARNPDNLEELQKNGISISP